MPERQGNNSGRGGGGQPSRRDTMDFVYEFHPQGVKSDKHYATFEMVKEQMLDSMKKKFKNARDTVDSIDQGSVVDLDKECPSLADFNSRYTIRKDSNGDENAQDRAAYDADEKGQKERFRLELKNTANERKICNKIYMRPTPSSYKIFVPQL